MFKPTFWAVTQPLGQNNPIAGFVYILPSAGLYLTQHFLECIRFVWGIRRTTVPRSDPLHSKWHEWHAEVCACVQSVEGFKCAPASRSCPPVSYRTGSMWECVCIRYRIVKTGSKGNCWVCLHSSTIKSTSSRCYWQIDLTDYRGTSGRSLTPLGCRCLPPVG